MPVLMQRPCQDLDCQSKSLAMSRLRFTRMKTATCRCSAYGNERFRFWDDKPDYYQSNQLAIACAEALARYEIKG